jgi:L-amino acid N-acyltransferase YncA
MSEYLEKLELADGTGITVRSTTRADVDQVMEFFDCLPDAEKQCVRVELRNREDFEKRYDKLDKGYVVRLVAEKEGVLIGEACLETMRYGWLRKSGEVRMVVHPDYRELGVPRILAREIFLLAARKGLDNLIARVVDCQKEALEIYKSLHFELEATQKKHAVDLDGNLHDVYLMTFNLRKMWRDMEEAIVEAIHSPLD